MTEPRYVQHFSGQGEKYVVEGETNISWRIRTPVRTDLLLYDLPKHEYKVCDPPVRWVDVTERCQPANGVLFDNFGDGRAGAVLDSLGVIHTNYRLRKVQQIHEYPKDPTWAFIIERRMP